MLAIYGLLARVELGVSEGDIIQFDDLWTKNMVCGVQLLYKETLAIDTEGPYVIVDDNSKILKYWGMGDGR